MWVARDEGTRLGERRQPGRMDGLGKARLNEVWDLGGRPRTVSGAVLDEPLFLQPLDGPALGSGIAQSMPPEVFWGWCS